MHLHVTCQECSHVATFVSTAVYAGYYPCPRCGLMGLFVPETELTPREPDPFSICEYETGLEWESGKRFRR